MRLVDADALWLDIANRSACLHDCCPRTKGKKGVLLLIDEAPTIEAEPVRNGRWIKQIPNRLGLSNYFVCSQCAMVTRTRYKAMMCEDAYCKHCGAKMDLKEGVVESG